MSSFYEFFEDVPPEVIEAQLQADENEIDQQSLNQAIGLYCNRIDGDEELKRMAIDRAINNIENDKIRNSLADAGKSITVKPRGSTVELVPSNSTIFDYGNLLELHALIDDLIKYTDPHQVKLYRIKAKVVYIVDRAINLKDWTMRREYW